MKKLLMMIGAAAVAVGACADTVTTNGETRTYTVLDSSKSPATVRLGDGTAACIAASTAVNAADIPWTFTNDGIDYTVTAIGEAAFYDCSKLSGTLAIPASVTSMGERAFALSGISAVSSIGGIATIPRYAFNTSSSLTDFTADISKVTKITYGAFQSCNLNHFYVPGSTTVDAERLFRSNKSFKLFFAGPNTTGSKVATSTQILSGVTTSNAKVFVPAKSSWNGLDVGGTGNEVVYYGATTNLDFVVDDAAKTITATPTDEEALVKVLESAPLFKTHFGWNTRVNITNTIEATAGTITAEMLNAVEFNTLLLTFKVNTQAALDSVLAAVPASNWPLLAIDASDSKEELTLPQGREIYVRVSGDGKQGKYIPKIRGLIISFH